jgi:hypothetical protein
VRILLICGIMMASCMDVQDGWIRDHEETRTLDLLSMGIGQGVLSFDFSLPLDTAEVNWGAVPATHQEIEGQKLLLYLNQPLEPGIPYEIFLSVKAMSGDAKVFLQSFYAPNNDLPLVRISEILNQGSSNHPDALELLCLSAGNLAGLSVRTSAPGNGGSLFDPGYVFPNTLVESGDYIILHFKPSGSPEEVDETEKKDASGGTDSHPEAWDFWWQGSPGLSGTDGMVALLDRPDGSPLVGVFYSNKQDNPGKYSGFGTKKAQESAQYLAEHGLWFDQGISPAQAVDNRHSTSTRTLNSTIVDGQLRWYTAPTRGASLGEENLGYDLRYIP